MWWLLQKYNQGIGNNFFCRKSNLCIWVWKKEEATTHFPSSSNGLSRKVKLNSNKIPWHVVWSIRLIVNKLRQTASRTKGPHLDYFSFGFNQNFSCLSTSHECMINPHKGSGALLFQASKHFHKLHKNTMSFNDLRLHTSLPFALCLEQGDNSVNQQTGGLIGASFVGNKIKVALLWQLPLTMRTTVNIKQGVNNKDVHYILQNATSLCLVKAWVAENSTNMPENVVIPSTESQYVIHRCKIRTRTPFFFIPAGCWDMESRQIFFPFLF